MIWVSAIALGVVLMLAAFALDAPVHRWQVLHRWKNIQQLSRNVTRMTDWPAHVILGLVLGGLAWWRGNRKWTRIFLGMIAAAAVAGVVAYGLKFSTGRVRPSVKTAQAWHGPDTHQNYQAFPSGHTAASAGFFAILFFVSWRLGLVCFAIPIFVGFTRIFLGAHYLSDVVVGLLLGLLAAAVVAPLVLRKNEWSDGSLGKARAR